MSDERPGAMGVGWHMPPSYPLVPPSYPLFSTLDRSRPLAQIPTMPQPMTEGPSMYRQGDVLLVPVDAVPGGAKDVGRENGRTVLAHGEVTGHHHSFDGDAGVALLEAPTGDRYLRVSRAAALEHQEHTTITVPPGVFRVIRQREYDDAEEWRRVAD